MEMRTRYGKSVDFSSSFSPVVALYAAAGIYYDDFEGENYQKIVNILQTEDWEILASDRS